jgi:mono/diheme cytochrome c family protein
MRDPLVFRIRACEEADFMKLWGLVFAVLIFVNLISENRANSAEVVDYARQIKPLLLARCYACHGVLKQAAGLRLDTVAFATKGGESGAAIKPGDVTASSLLERIAATEESERMPPEGEPLKPAEIAVIQAWIAQGAQAPADEQAERDPRDHWAFKTPRRPPLPVVANPEWNKNPIDAFVAAEYQKRGLTPQRPAEKRLWLRRVSLDLVGLPPTPAEMEAFVADVSGEAYDKVVTRLLDSPQYGERWGRHWMDIWRYSDWWGLGAEVRNSQKHIWHWRDWIIESINADQGYDQMLREMLAADELYPNDLNKLRASGFLARQYFKFNRTSWLDEAVEHTSKAMLGLTFNCAKCHDHKYDPFSQVEYYRIRAIFEPYQVRTDLVSGELDFEKDGIPRAFDCNLDAKTYLHIRGDDRNPDKNRVIDPGVPAFLSLGEFKSESVALPVEAFHPGLRTFVVEANLAAAERRIADARTALEASKKKLVESEKMEALVAATRAANPATPAPTETSVLVQDDFGSARPDLWEMRAGDWYFSNYSLVQAKPIEVRSELRLRQPPPLDFEAKLKYVATGGTMWKSVGITFDGTDAGNEIVTYLSSYAGGPKSQVSYKQGGSDVYPANGAQTRPVELQQPHELVLRVRGQLVNLIIDGQHSVAYELPIARQKGFLQLITYDATAEFRSFELRALPVAMALVAAASAPGNPAAVPLSVDQAKSSVAIAEKVLAAAEVQPASVKARIAADRIRFLQIPMSGTATPLTDAQAAERYGVIRESVRTERIVSVAKADEEVSRLELQVLQATADKKVEVQTKLTAAKTALQAARMAAELPDWPAAGTPAEIQEALRKAIAAPTATYAEVKGALKTLESNQESEESRNKPFPATSTGRRSAFARWITDSRHPLPARVAVNHLWSRHFGKALVPTLFDFGRKGTPPTHPELLDWLAVEFVEHGWSMKHLHRLIVTSNTYRLSSSSAGATPETLAADPDNRFYWRANAVRMEAQGVRDSLLHLAGELDLTRGGPSIPVSNEGSQRRSLYFVHSHNEHQKFLSMFDDASVLECYRRSDSIVPQQALALENSPLATAMAEKIADRITAAHPNASERDFIQAAFLMVLCVEPSEVEFATTADALARLTAAAKLKNRPDPQRHVRISLVQALLNHNDFVTVR